MDSDMLNCRATEQEIQGHAIWSAGRVRDLIYRTTNMPTTSSELKRNLHHLAQVHQAKPVDLDKELSSTIARMSDAGWWARNLRRELIRENESQEHAAAAIHKLTQCYVSDHAVKVKRTRRKANKQTLDALEVVNEHGEAFNLGEVANSSISNPALRRAELMMRCRGFEEVANVYGHVARFLTITAPSRFHRFHGDAKDEIPNPKWDGSSPKDAQNYLSDIWKRIRAAWHRKGFTPYGFRVAEPHHDGCPHWHILLWMPKEQAGWFSPMKMIRGEVSGSGIVGIVGAYAMRDSTNEINYRNRTARFDVKVIKESQGTATGYIAKYICKNVDGLREDGTDMGEDLEADAPVTVASGRVRDWASVWGIRQFQQIGGPSVTVWRELRRMREEIDQAVTSVAFDFEGVRKAVDDSKWAQFWILLGGPWTKRADLAMKPFLVEAQGGKYGDTIKRIFGVTGRNDSGEYMLRTRMHEWSVQRAGLHCVNVCDAEHKEWMHLNKELQQIEREWGLPVRGDVRFPLGGFEESTPRTSVNNCTDFAIDIPRTGDIRSPPISVG